MIINHTVKLTKTAPDTDAIRTFDWSLCQMDEIIRKGICVQDKWSFSTRNLSMFKSVEASTSRWITVHPNGREEKGVPIKIRMVSGKAGIKFTKRLSC